MVLKRTLKTFPVRWAVLVVHLKLLENRTQVPCFVENFMQVPVLVSDSQALQENEQSMENVNTYMCTFMYTSSPHLWVCRQSLP